MKPIKIAVVGKPNVGKSMLINALTNSRLRVANFSGVTVQKSEVFFYQKKGNNQALIFIDLPGIYSLNPITKDEQITYDFLHSKEYDLILNVIEANALSSNLELSLELSVLDKPIVIALNMLDELNSLGGKIDTKKLSNLIGVPVNAVSAKEKIGLNELIYALNNTNLSNTCTNFKILHSDVILNAVSEVAKIATMHKLPLTTSQIIDLLQDNQPRYEVLTDVISSTRLKIIAEFEGQNIRHAFSIYYHDLASELSSAVLSGRSVFARQITEKIDGILVHKIFGLPIFILLMWVLFQATFKLGKFPASLIEIIFNQIYTYSSPFLTSKILKSLVLDGVLNGIKGVMIFLPNIFIMFFGISVFEKTGYIARIAFLFDGLLAKFGLHGKSFIPLVTGFGCSIPAYISTRIIQNPSERIITMLILGFIPCSAKLSVFVLLCGAFFGAERAGNVLFIIYLSGIVFALLAAKILQICDFKEAKNEIFAMEMPRYRFPSFASLMESGWVRVRSYLQNAGTMIAFCSFTVWFLSYFPNSGEFETSFLAMISRFTEPVFAPLHFDWRVISSLFSGLVAKEVAISTLSILYDSGGRDLTQILRNEIPFKTGLAMIVFMFFYLPCLSATSVFAKEVGSKKITVFLILTTTILAYFGAWVAYLVAGLF